MANKGFEKWPKALRTQVTLPEKVWDVLEENYKDILGTKKAEIVERIIIIFLTERGHFNPKMMFKRMK